MWPYITTHSFISLYCYWEGNVMAVSSKRPKQSQFNLGEKQHRAIPILLFSFFCLFFSSQNYCYLTQLSIHDDSMIILWVMSTSLLYVSLGNLKQRKNMGLRIYYHCVLYNATNGYSMLLLVFFCLRRKNTHKWQMSWRSVLPIQHQRPNDWVADFLRVSHMV